LLVFITGSSNHEFRKSTKELGDALGIKTAPTFDKSGKLFERTFTDYAKTAVLQSAVSTTMTMVVDGVDPGEALKQGAVSAVVNTAAAWCVGKIGGMYRVKAVVHKMLHAGLGAASGTITSSILGGDVRMAALSGVTGAFLAETLADVLKPDEKAKLKSAVQNKMDCKEFEDAFMAKAQASGLLGNFMATVVAFGLGQDAGIAYGAAHNATANNNMMYLGAFRSSCC